MSKNFNPKVSIVIPVYNGSNYLKEAIDSALAQTYKNIEVIVINDGSNDRGATEKIAKSYGNKIRYFLKENGGVATALNLSIEKMKGDFFSWLSHDDLYHKDKVKKQIEFLETLDNKNVVLYGDYEYIDKSGKYIGGMKLDNAMLKEKPEYALLRGSINGLSLLIPKKAFKESGEFDKKLRCTQDYDMWSRIMQKYKFVHLEGSFVMTRVHSQQDSVMKPEAISEGDSLWIGMMKSVPKKRRIELEGSDYNFFMNMHYHLMQSAYKKAEQYALEEANKAYSKINNKVRPLVSVIIPCFNHGSSIEETVNSVLGQTYDNYEIIIIDDGSTDKYTNKLLKAYKKPKTKVYHTKSLGVSSAREYGLSLAKGKYVQFLDADDLIDPCKLEEQIRVFQANPELDICYSSYRYLTEETGVMSGPSQSVFVGQNPLDDFLYRWQRDLSIPIHSALFEKNVFSEKSFVAHLKAAEDWVMWVDAASRRARFSFVNKALVTYRLHDKNTTKNKEKTFYGACMAVSHIYETYKDKIDVERYHNEQAAYLSYLAEILLPNQQLEIQKRTFENSISWRITKPLRLARLTFNTLKKEGAVVTSKKIVKKVIKKINSMATKKEVVSH